MTNKVVSPKQQSQVTSPTTSFPDPFGLPANTNNTFNAFGGNNDPFGSTRADDPFVSATSSPAVFNQKLDESDPFRPVDFNSAHDLIKKSMANRSKTPGANMFGGNDFSQAIPPPANRAQSAMPWESTHQPPTQSGTKPLNDLFDVFG
jgi:hypothetical protein